MPRYGVRQTSDISPSSIDTGHWVDGLFEVIPRERVPLVGLINKMGKQSIDSYHTHWLDYELPQFMTALPASTSVYSNSTLTTAITTTTLLAVDTVYYVKMSATEAGKYRVGNNIRIHNTTAPAQSIWGEVVSLLYNGASSYVAIKVNNAVSMNFGAAMVFDCIGNIAAEAGSLPDTIGFDGTERSNVTQIWTTAIVLSRTRMQTKTREGDIFARERKEKGELHLKAIEGDLLWGARRSYTVSGHPKRTTDGIERQIFNASPNSIITAASGATVLSPLDSTTIYTLPSSATAWTDYGWDFLSALMEAANIYGGGLNTIHLCGSGVIKALSKLAMSLGVLNMTMGKDETLGLNVNTITSEFGTWKFIETPALSLKPSYKNTIITLPLEHIEYRALQDTILIKSKDEANYLSASLDWFDGTSELWLTEATVCVRNPKACQIVHNVGIGIS